VTACRFGWLGGFAVAHVGVDDADVMLQLFLLSSQRAFWRAFFGGLFLNSNLTQFI
jgi:hypothetical protein